MTNDTAVSLSDPLFAPEPDLLLFWLEQDVIDALAAAIAGWAPLSPYFDLEAMILGGDDGETAYWFEPSFEPPCNDARDAVISGSDDGDILHGREEADLLFGLEGADILQDVRGNNLFDGGAGADIIEGAGQSLYIGGTGDDVITAWGADFTLAFNAGDGFDTVVLCARGPATISLGLGIDTADVYFTRHGNDLVIHASATEGMALTGWYDDPAPDPLRLQLIGEAGVQACDLMPLIAALADRQAAQLGQADLQDAGPASGELAAAYATSAGGIEITGASATIWTDGFGLIAGLGLLL